MSHLLWYVCLSFILFSCLSLSLDGTDQVTIRPPGVPCPHARTHLRPGGTWRSGACGRVCRATSLEGEAQQVLITQSLTALASDWCGHIRCKFPTEALDAACATYRVRNCWLSRLKRSLWCFCLLLYWITFPQQLPSVKQSLLFQASPSHQERKISAGPDYST